MTNQTSTILTNIEQMVINALEKKPYKTFQSLFDKVGNCRTTVYDTFQELLNDNTIIKTEIGYSLNRISHSPRFEELGKWYSQSSENYLKQLRKIKPLFKDIRIEKLETGGTSTTYWINPKGRGILQNYLMLIEEISATANAITYYSIINKKHKTELKTLHRDQKYLYNKMNSMIRKLKRRYQKDIIALDSFIYWNSPTMRRIKNLEKTK